MEPERKIEKLLRAYAKKRRGDAGEPLKLHPAARRLLQDEVSRHTPKPETEETSLSLWQLFRQQWALLLSFTLMIFLGTMLFLPALSNAKRKAQYVSALSNLKQIGIAAQMAAEENNGRLPASLSTLTNGLVSEQVLNDPVSGKPFVYIAGGENLDNLKNNDVLAFSPENKKGRAVLFANGRVEYATRARFAELTNQKSFQLALADKSASERPVEATVNAPVAMQSAASASEAATKLERQKLGTVRRQLVQTGVAGNLQNLYRNGAASAQATPVLQSFQVLQHGDAVSVVDRDGSVYRGSVQSANTGAIGQLPVEKAAALATPPPVGGTLAPVAGNEPTAIENYSFRVAGTNRTLKQNVVFTGNVEVFSNATANTRQTYSGGRSEAGQFDRLVSTNQQQWPLSNSRVVGMAVIGHTNRIEVNAAPLLP